MDGFNVPNLVICRCVRFDSSDVDTSVGVRTQLYHQLSTLLKSVIAAARVTPTYRYYARKQSPETFIIIYRVSASASSIIIVHLSPMHCIMTVMHIYVVWYQKYSPASAT